MSIINLKEKKYKWHFVNIGGSARVRINSGEDIAHLGELDPKMWTVLSCPTTGLEIDDKSLKYMDCDGDAKLRINDVVCVAQWITNMLKDKDLILKGVDSIDINMINTEDANGKKLYSSAKQILENLGKEGTVISLALRASAKPRATCRAKRASSRPFSHRASAYSSRYACCSRKLSLPSA